MARESFPDMADKPHHALLRQRLVRCQADLQLGVVISPAFAHADHSIRPYKSMAHVNKSRGYFMSSNAQKG
jgi:hypothetical protein